MEDEELDSFYDVDQLLMEEGLIASTVLPSEIWEQNLVSHEVKDLTENQRLKVVYHLMGLKEEGRLPWGIQTKLAREFGCHKSTVNKLLKRVEKQQLRGEALDVSNRKKGNSGRKPYYTNSDKWLQSAPLHKRGTYRAYAAALGCSHMHVFRLLKKGLLRAHTSPNHPNVSDKNKVDRLKWVLQHIQPAASVDEKAKFVDMKNIVHIDEKWFYLNPTTRRFYLLPKEIDPYRTSKSKNYSIKVMFMGVTAKPQFSAEGDIIFDGKIGIFPFVIQERARKRSKNRAAGTLETKAITNVNQAVTRDLFISKVIPCIKEKWLAFLSKDIMIQQDNARPHIKDTDPDFRAVASADGFNIHLINQPAQSPDFNILDLSLFRALQSLQYQSFPKNVDELIERVNEAYEEFSPTLIKYAWITLQLVMVEALKVQGGNNYKLPHIGKKRLERLGTLPEIIEVDQDIIYQTVNHLNSLSATEDQGNTETDMYTEEYLSAYFDAEEQFNAYLDASSRMDSDEDEEYITRFQYVRRKFGLPQVTKWKNTL